MSESIHREGPTAARFYIEVADVEDGRYRPDPVFPEMFLLEDLAERVAEHALNRFPVARVCEEKMVYRRKEGA